MNIPKEMPPAASSRGELGSSALEATLAEMKLGFEQLCGYTTIPVSARCNSEVLSQSPKTFYEVYSRGTLRAA